MAVLVLDNGGYTAKIGYFNATPPKLIPNSVIKAKNVRNRIFIGDQIDDCKDLSGLYYLLAFQKGYLVNWDIERQVWDHLFGKDCMKVEFDETSLVITEPYFNFTSIQEAMNEVLFEEYQFQSLLRCNAGMLSQHKYTKETGDPVCCLVVDSGYSFTHIVPYYKGKKISEGIKRISVGGKILSNHLKEVISYRQLMVMDETYVMNQAKEDVSFVSQDFVKDMELAKLKGKENTIVRDYVLPDYTHIKRGHMRPLGETTGKAQGSEQIIRVSNERFAIPEILMHPSDIGIQEMGIPETIEYAIQCTPEELHPHLSSNIILTGGNCLIPGFRDRIYKEVRALMPDEFDVNVTLPNNAVTFAWQGGAMVAGDAEFPDLLVSKEEYNEYGHSICMDKFDI